MKWFRSRRGVVSVLLAAACLLPAGAGAGALAAYHFVAPVYRSDAVIRVQRAAQPVCARQSPIVFCCDDQGAWLNQYVSFVARLARSRRVCESAVQDPALQAAAGRPLRPEELRDGLSAQTRPGSDFLVLSYSCGNPKMAAAGVTAVVNVLTDEFRSAGEAEHKQHVAVVDERLADLKSRIDTLQMNMGSTGADRPPPGERGPVPSRLSPEANQEAVGPDSNRGERARQEEELQGLRAEAERWARSKEQILVEPDLGNRLVIMLSGEVPSAPLSRWDGKREARGAAAGAAAALLVLIVPRFARRRTRSPARRV
jgi:hypothetical protein